MVEDSVKGKTVKQGSLETSFTFNEQNSKQFHSKPEWLHSQVIHRAASQRTEDLCNAGAGS